MIALIMLADVETALNWLHDHWWVAPSIGAVVLLVWLAGRDSK